VSGVYLHTTVAMSTVVSIQVIGHDEAPERAAARDAAVARATDWFARVEACCSRFDPDSELRRLSTAIGAPVPVSAMLFEAVRFAVAVAEDSDGAFDPTVGLAMEAAGFDRHHRTGEVARALPGEGADAVTYRDVILDADARTIRLARPLVLDLGAVAKGLAVDMAARELAPLRNYAIDAGGDLYLAGCNQDGAPWAVGVRDPRRPEEVIDTLHVSDLAVCTSGDYERRGSSGRGHHLLDPRTRGAATALASATVVASSAMVADALATAAFVLGPVHGLQLLERSGVEGLLVTPARERVATAGLPRGMPSPR